MQPEDLVNQRGSATSDSAHTEPEETPAGTDRVVDWLSVWVLAARGGCGEARALSYSHPAQVRLSKLRNWALKWSSPFRTKVSTKRQ